MRLKKWFSSKTVIITAGIILAGYLVLILAVTNVGQSKLKESQHSELHLKVTQYVNTLSYFFNVTRENIYVLANDQTMSTFFANRSSGMSMEYGLGSSLFNLKMLIYQLTQDSQIDALPVYKRMMLVSFDKTVIVDTDPHSPINFSPIPFKKMQEKASDIIVTDDPSGLNIRILRTIYQQNKAVALLIADINTDLIAQQLSTQEHADSASRLQLNTPSGNIYVWNSIKSTLLSVPPSNSQSSTNKLYIEEPVKGTPFILMSWFEPVNEQDIFTSGWFIAAISVLAFPVVIGLYFLMRIEHSNTILQTQIEVSSKQQNKLSQHNLQLETEVKKRKNSEERLAYQATHDALTGLANRSYSHERLTQAIHYSQRDNTQILVMFIDLDNFKQINDTLGHIAGDQILKDTSTRLINSVRSTDTVARLGGDEFLLIIPELLDDESAEMLAGKILALFEKPFKVENQEFFTTTSIGMAIYPQDGRDPDSLLKSADMALYRVKDAGRNGFSFYDPAMNDALLRSLSLNSRLRQAISNNEIEMYYQPIIDLKSRKIIAAEALMRWNDNELGSVSPEEFISLAEKNGLIHQLGEFALEQACTQAAEWQSICPLQIAVNFSSVQFRYSTDLLNKIENILEKSALPAHKLDIEVTESLLVSQNSELAYVLDRLNELGIRLSIDDFGTGYSALSYLQQFPFSKLKIDRAFVNDLETNPADMSLVSAILAMAKALKLKVVAEGIEDNYQADLLEELQCDYGQGYLFSRALPADDFTRLLVKEKVKNSA
ncbi:putative bifunctional diguanylate cyclase/phosphodiesterase [Psychromonas aquimarina]|uniref:putative bifunctional diguanylate cyclase/phosphodiesterase n=1 Tax=Psychromonas aquimarina TaxID=444919 RepID=UPI000406C38C|nr:EAL domain-containing protein [Psychromonas aquimarina]